MTESLTTYNYLEEYMNKIRSRGRYSFTLEEAKNEFSVSEKALAQSIFRLKSKKKITQIRKGFYAIIPPEYSATGMLPVPLFIEITKQKLLCWLVIGCGFKWSCTSTADGVFCGY